MLTAHVSQVISAKNLTKPGKSITSPFAEMEVVGLGTDKNKSKTVVVRENGLNPPWVTETIKFDVRH